MTVAYVCVLPLDRFAARYSLKMTVFSALNCVFLRMLFHYVNLLRRCRQFFVVVVFLFVFEMLFQLLLLVGELFTCQINCRSLWCKEKVFAVD